ncbi:PREDICTED: extended synaptotagmin-2-like [Priapulus caudatus]|uniref:Extended synaptotagmin-2-like n=1 Tax=Priapulus caudatus TaxID=37621 RepID=A0ABM1E1N5_PRICU|nr:PREDICTED: extended synaptotagmin-2-like [Priapulus caudatus]
MSSSERKVEASEKCKHVAKGAAKATKSTLKSELLPILMKFVKGFSILSGVWLVGYYRYSLSWVLLGLPIWLWTSYKQNKQIEKRMVQHEIVNNEKEVILASIEDLPSWVFFPDVERAEWLNKIILQMWPYINDFANQIMKDIIEPSIRDNLPSSLKSFMFEKCDLGDIAPRVGGVKVYTDAVHRDEIVMDMEIFYAGDMNVKVAVNRIRCGVKNITMHGTMRFVLKPLIGISPLVGAVTVYFLNPPDIDFDLTNLGNVLDIPGLSEILRKIVVAQIGAFAVMPNSITVPLTDQVDLKELKFKQPNGVLRVEVVEASELKKMDVGLTGKGKSDPYAVVTVGACSFKTAVKNNTVEPVWNAFFEAVVGECKGQAMELEIFDQDPGVMDDDFLGRANVDILSIAKKGREDTWIVLDDIKHGNVHLRMDWLSLSADLNDLETIKAENSKQYIETNLATAMLMVFLDSAGSLPNARKSASEPSPVVMMTVAGSEKRESTVKYATNQPVWEERFVFLVHNPELQDLDVQVKDMKTSKPLGMLSINLNELLNAPEMEMRQPYKLKESGQESTLTIWLRMRVLAPGPLTTAVPVAACDYDAVDELSNGAASAIAESNGVPSAATTPTEEMVKVVEEPIVAATPAWKPEMSPTSTMESVRQRNADGVADQKGKDEHLGQIQLTLSYSKERKRFIILVQKCSDLLACDDDDLADPYVRVYLLPDKTSSSKRKTQVIKNTLNPVYDETLEYPGTIDELKHKTLDITVKNQVGMFARGRNIIGQVLIDLDKFDFQTSITKWFVLTPSGREMSP